MKKLLCRYPFSDKDVRLVEGFSAYDGVLGDEPGTPHRGIDYVLKNEESFVTFDVHAMHDGMAFQGKSESWGNFVIIHAEPTDGFRYSTVYAHLDDIPASIAQQFTEQDGQRVPNERGTELRAGQVIGRAGTSGWTNGIIQLHLELHVKDEATGKSQKLDPYGINDRASSGKYPQPGESLAGLNHAWIEDVPPFKV